MNAQGINSNIPLGILIVDDDQNFARTLGAILQANGHHCRVAHSVIDAQAILAKDHFDCILSDVRMPNQSGTELYDQIKEKYPHLPFILMTAYTSSDIIEKALQAGVLTALQKPLDIETVLHFMTRLSQKLKAAIICEERKVSQMIKEILKNEKFAFKVYPSIPSLIRSSIKDYSIVLIDAHQPYDHYSLGITSLLEYLPNKTIVIICDFKKSIEKEILQPEKVNLVVLPHEIKSTQEIDKILAKEIYKRAKELIH